MHYTTLGATGLKVSVAGLGCGGNSLLGKSAGLTQSQSADLVRAALDLGVTFLDTAEAYGTEEIVGEAIASRPRDRIVISTKSRIEQRVGMPGGAAGLMSGADVVANLDASLRRLRTDYVDVFHLHAVSPSGYDHALHEIAPAVLREKAKGKLRHLGITETSPFDHEQEMAARAVTDDVWEVIMIAYHMLNQKPRQTIFPHTQKKRIGTLLMFVVRNIFSRPEVLARTMAALAAAGKLPPELASVTDPLDFLVHEAGATSITDAAYRFGRHEPGADVVLFGTGSVEHLRANVTSILRPALPAADVTRLYALFAGLRGVGLDLPDRMKA